MVRTFEIAFRLKNARRVNGILFSLRQIPLLGKRIPVGVYRSGGLKVFAGVLAAIWEILTVFLGKFLYLLLMVGWASSQYGGVGRTESFLHIFFFLTLVGAFYNTYLFNPTSDKYYAVILMRMDARRYALTDYAYAIAKVLAGFLACGLFFGRQAGVPWGLCLLMPVFVAGCKLCVAGYVLWDYERNRRAMNENLPEKWIWALGALLLAAAYGLPAIGWVLPWQAFAAASLCAAGAGIACAWKAAHFQEYRPLLQELLRAKREGTDLRTATAKAVQEQNRKMISEDRDIRSSKKGFEYFNDLFVKRHRRILWKSSVRQAGIAALLVAAGSLAAVKSPEAAEAFQELLPVFLPYFVFIMYALNRGTSFTQALFMNCDRSMLTYSFYKRPGFILRLFVLRLREIIKVNLLPAAVIGFGLAFLLYVSGGAPGVADYGVMVVSILALSIFFSVHYLTIYYLLQPYNAQTEMKNAAYRLISWATYLICFVLMQLRFPNVIFGALCTAFCVLYCIAACVLVHRFAARTFRLRN